MMNLEDIVQLLQRDGSGLSPDDYDEASQPAGLRERRVQALQPVLETCRHLWQSGAGELDLIAEKLGDASRDPAWRGPFGEAGILMFFLDCLAAGGLRQGLHIHALRIVGNSCADTDENRKRVVDDNLLAPLIRDLSIEGLIPFSIPVLFNILVDYEPAQRLASQSKLSHHLIRLLSSQNLPNYAPFVTYFFKILALLVAQEGELAQADPLTVPTLLGLATNPSMDHDLEDFVALVSVAVAYLASEAIQMSVITEDKMPVFLDLVQHIHTNIEVDQVDDPDVVDQIRQLKISLLTSLADLTGNDAFLIQYPLQSNVATTFWTWLRSPNPGLQSSACLALGNYTRSDDVSQAFVHTHAAHVPVINLISRPGVDDAQLLHAALSFLKNMAIPAANKPLLGDLFNAPCLPRMYALDSLPHVQFAAVSLTRILLVNCPDNVRRICTPLSADPSSSASERTNVYALCEVFERSDAEPTRLEAARAISVICRVLHSNPVAPILPDWVPTTSKLQPAATEPDETTSAPPYDDTDDSKRRHLFYTKHNISKALSFLVTQTKWPLLRSEAWFVFALMCRSRDGAATMITVLNVQATNQALIETITGRKTHEPKEQDTSTDDVVSQLTGNMGLEPQQVDPTQRASMASVDRENAVVFCSELLRNWREEMPPLRQALLRDLLKEGGELIAASKAAAA
ncbi:armadillo-type protein [Stachybotrys elegans]|uniref:Armadillo-type protein n=1 Tax=Stachybotrys elegans TaxID=80388 RepID=A0A8K0WP82_9HYPO|nr:armadillo-type protein [Stachybotrys elegans]